MIADPTGFVTMVSLFAGIGGFDLAAVRDTDTPQADSSRYRQLGNAVAVPVVEWIMRRLVAADSDGLNEFHPDSTWNPEATS